MHIIFISACEKKAIKRTRAILDSYAIRTGQNTWQAPMTMEGLAEVRQALRKVSTRQTAVIAYRNYGNRRMKIAWVVGSRHKFSLTGAYPVASTSKQQNKPIIADWIKVSSLLAGASGNMHDIGKASVHFQQKLSPSQSGQIIKDDIRHEWISMKLLQNLRNNQWQWQQAWQDLPQHLDKLILGDKKLSEVEIGISNEIEAVDYLVLTHHGLLGADDENQALSFPSSGKHIRKYPPKLEQIQCAGDLAESIFISYQKRMQRLAKLLPANLTNNGLLYWKAQVLHARNALIHADHVISAMHYSSGVVETTGQLFANTKIKKDDKNQIKRLQDQPLLWHLENVGDRASYIATQMMVNLSMAGLSEQTTEYICQPTAHSRFNWQNVGVNALHRYVEKLPNSPALIFNIAGTGSGKTRMNLRLACTLRPNEPRISIALNLRSLTLQTGEALKSSMNLSDDELAVIIGDTTTQQLFEKSIQRYQDDDENPIEPIFDSIGMDNELPTWLQPLYHQDPQGRTILTSPLLVSTIDYLIAGGEPHKQGHHVKAFLRLISSDLILDEIDSYEPKSLMAVLRLVQISAMYGRHVICSSATLSTTVAQSVYSAFQSGLQMKEALNAKPQSAIIAIIDNEIKPTILQEMTDNESNFQHYYQQHLDSLQQHLKSKPVYRLAKLIPLENQRVSDWHHAVLNASKQLHLQHGWQFSKTQKRISFGLVRVANVYQAIALAQFLADNCSEAKIACYHANDWLISRFYKEQRLDSLLTRHKNNKTQITGNERIEQDEEIQHIVQNSLTDNVIFIVVATPVEEVGRDHDFDWAVIDASSIQSIVQTAGRVNRHRLNPVTVANIMIPQYNYRYCHNQDNHREKDKVFVYPGFEMYGSKRRKAGYPTHDLAKLLPWDTQNTLVIDASLRFDKNYCQFARLDDENIQNFCKKYFSPVGDSVFSNPQVNTCLMTEQIYRDYTPLREKQYQKKYLFQYDNDDNLAICTQEYTLKLANDKIPYPHYGFEWQLATLSFSIQTAKNNAWLNLTPKQMITLCQTYDIDVQQGCQVALNVYHKDSLLHWGYDLGFGIYSLKG